MGRKYKPNKAKKLSGSKYYRPEVPDGNGAPRMPPGILTDDAKWAWRYIVPKLDKMGVLDDIDLFVLMSLCDAVGDFIWASKVMTDENYRRVGRTSNGNKVQDAAVGMKRTARNDMYNYACALGLSPADREKLFKNMSDAKEISLADEFAAAMNG